MAAKLMQQGCSDTCKEHCEFEIKITIEKLCLADKDKARGFEEVSVVLTFESNVIKIENIQSPDDSINVQKIILCQITPEKFAKKLRESPLLINVSRQCADLGTIKLELNEYFTEAVLCDEFTSEMMVCDYKFVKDGTENGSMDISVQVLRKPVDSEAIKDFLRSNEKKRERMKAKKAAQQQANSQSSDDTLSSFMCDADLLNELCPMDENVSSTKSSKQSKASKCLSDIAASLDVNKFSDNQKTFCHGCRGYSVSGVTCENKVLFTDKGDAKSSGCTSYSSLKRSVKQRKKCTQPVNRVCSECFANLSVLPKNVPCPHCTCMNKISKIEETKRNKNDCGGTSETYFQKMLKDIILGGEKKVAASKVYLGDTIDKCKENKKSNKKGKKRMSKKSPFPRCSKVKTTNKKSNIRDKSLRLKNYGVVAGHKDCKNELMLVPKNMGWLWNASNPGISKIRRGWKPGAIQKSVARTMKCFLTKECDPPADGNCLPCMNEIPPKSTLKVEKKLGEYKITLNPLRDDSCGDTPIVFKISKTEDEKRRCSAREFLKRRGITKCCDCNDICECCCISDCRKQTILHELEAISNVMCLNPPMKYEELNEACECSEIDFEFTPPFEMMNKCRRDVKVSVAETQYEEQELVDDEESSSEDEVVVKKTKKKAVKKKEVCKKKAVNSRPQKQPEILPDRKPPVCPKPPVCRQPCFVDPCERFSSNLYPRCQQNYKPCPPARMYCYQNFCSPMNCNYHY